MAERHKHIPEQVRVDTNEMTRGVPQVTRNKIYPYMSSLYQERGSEYSQNGSRPVRFSEEILLDQVANGNGVVMHHQRDFEALAQTVLETTDSEALKLSAVACPAWIRGRIGGEPTADPDLRTLSPGIHDTTLGLVDYVDTLSDRARRFRRPVELSIQYAGYEVTRDDSIPNNGGLSSKEALGIVEASSQSLQETLNNLDNEYLDTQVRVYTGYEDDFHMRVDDRMRQLLSTDAARVNGVYRARRPYYPNGPEQAARDMAESELMFQQVSKGSDILIVSTSPAMARACMSGRGYSWIQLNPPKGF